MFLFRGKDYVETIKHLELWYDLMLKYTYFLTKAMRQKKCVKWWKEREWAFCHWKHVAKSKRYKHMTTLHTESASSSAIQAPFLHFELSRQAQYKFIWIQLLAWAFIDLVGTRLMCAFFDAIANKCDYIKDCYLNSLLFLFVYLKLKTSALFISNQNI